METDDDEIVTNNFETQGSSTTQNKRTINPASTEKSSSKKQKTSTNDGESPTLKRLIKELKMTSSALSTTSTQPPIANPGNLTELCDAIITAEDKNIATNQEIIKRYYSFGEELEKFSTNSKAVIENVRLRGCSSRKLQNSFQAKNAHDKIQLIKSFSASQIYKLSWDDIDAIEAEFE